MVFIKDWWDQSTWLRFLGSLKAKLYWVRSNYRILIIIKAKHLNKYENISKLLGELLGKLLVNEMAGIPGYIKQREKQLPLQIYHWNILFLKWEIKQHFKKV